MFGNILDVVGNTPVVRLNSVLAEFQVEFYAKLEYFNPLGSVKERPALFMIDDAEKKGLLRKGGVVIEATSGNMGIGLAFIGSLRGYKVIITMPENMSFERRKILELLGAEVVLTPAELGMHGAIEKAKSILNGTENSFMPNQFENEANVLSHEKTTAEEILRDFGSSIDYIVCGIGTGGTVTGLARRIKREVKGAKFVAVEPAESPVLSGGNKGSHGIEGIGAGFIPKILDLELIDEIITVSTEEALYCMKELSFREGIFAGKSSGAVLAALKKMREFDIIGKKVLGIFPDSGMRYLTNFEL